MEQTFERDHLSFVQALSDLLNWQVQKPRKLDLQSCAKEH
jgi:hypothetical protein